MTMHNDHHIKDAEDAAFDSTMKIAGIVAALLAIAVFVFWYLGA